MADQSNHEVYIKRCFYLARLGGRDTLTNPNVGSVLVYKGRVIGEGYHMKYGGPHAEINCLSSVAEVDRAFIKDATLYVSLEPCCIVSKTPACTSAIIDHQIKHVVIAATDPNEKVNGQSIKLLESHGVKVEHGVLEEEGLRVIAPFRAHLEGRPYLILKYAQSSDGYMGKRGQQVWITNAYSKLKVHKWRSEVDGILVGHNTVTVDNPDLGTRLVPGSSPTRIVFTREIESLVESSIYKSNKKNIIVCPATSHKTTTNIILTEDYSTKEGLTKTLNKLFDLGINYLMVEGGSKTHKLFIMNDLWDEARILSSSTPMVSGIRAPLITGLIARKEDLNGDKLSYIYRHVKS